jgi:UDP-N-acetylmuramoyl-tripeptide--D-alanyl-D-alanine ligase
MNLLFIFQLGGYSIKQFLVRDFFCNRRFFVSLIAYLFVSLIFCCFEFWKICLFYAAISFFVLHIHDFYCCKILKIKFRKRLVRLIVLLFLFNIVLFFILNLLPVYFIVFFNLLLVVFNRLFIIFAHIILLPIEFFIGRCYLSKAKKKLNNSNLKYVIGITGSFGKTSTKEILYTMLKEAYSVIATPKSYNTPFGISKTILSGLQDYHDVFVCEMGAKKEGEIKFLCNYTNVNCGIVTSVGRQHTNTFGNIDGVYRAKKELPDFLKNNFCVFFSAVFIFC